MFDKLIYTLNDKLKSNKWIWRLVAGIGLAVIAVLLMLKYKLMSDQAVNAAVIKSVAKEKSKDAKLSEELSVINEKEKRIDKTIVASDKVLRDLQKDRQNDVKRHDKAVKTIENLNSWDDVDKVVKK
jgi:hypothetical protein